jgi:muconolactone D-isomerase
MEYLIDFLITFPADMPGERRAALLDDEAAAVADLAERGHALRVWRPREQTGGPDGPLHVIGLYVGASDEELEALLDALPLAPWIAYSYTAVEPAGSDPGRG